MVKILWSYDAWHLSHQMEASFITAAVFVSSILAIMSYCQINWLRQQMLDGTEDLLKDNAAEHMHQLAE